MLLSKLSDTHHEHIICAKEWIFYDIVIHRDYDIHENVV